MSRPIARMQSRVERMARATSRAISRANRSADALSGGLMRAGASTAVAGALAGVAMVNVVKTGAEFEHSVNTAAAKFPERIKMGTKAFDELSQAAATIGAETEFMAMEAGQALDFLAMAGFDAKQAIAALPGVVDLATVGNMDLATATDMASDSLGAFNLMSKDAAVLQQNLARVNDIFAKTTTSANTNIEQMFEAAKDAGPVVTATGHSMETFAAMTGKLADAGIKGSKAGMVLKNMFLRLAAPPSEAAGALKMLGVETQDAAGNLRDITAVIDDLNVATTGMGSATKAGVLNDIFGMRAVAGATVLLQRGGSALREYRKDIDAAAGTSKSIATQMRGDTSGAIKSAESAWEGLKIAVAEATKEQTKGALASSTAWMRANRGMVSGKVTQALRDIKLYWPEIVSGAKMLAATVGGLVAWVLVVRFAGLAMATLNGALVLGRGIALAYRGAVWLATAATKSATLATAANTVASRSSTVALGARAAATRVVALVTSFATWAIRGNVVATGAGSIATAGATLKSWAHAAALRGQAVSTWATSRASWAATGSAVRLGVVTAAGTVKAWAHTAAITAKRVVLGAMTRAGWAAAASTVALAAAEGKATIASWALATPLAAILVTLAAIGAAVAAIVVAIDQIKKLADELGGWGGLAAFATGGFDAADERMNQKAREEAARRRADDAKRNKEETEGYGTREAPVNAETEMVAIQKMMADLGTGELTIKGPADIAKITKQFEGRGPKMVLAPSGAD